MDVGGAPAAVLLSPTGEAGWRATDPSYPLTDARSLLAYVEAVAGRYPYVTGAADRQRHGGRLAGRRPSDDRGGADAELERRLRAIDRSEGCPS